MQTSQHRASSASSGDYQPTSIAALRNRQQAYGATSTAITIQRYWKELSGMHVVRIAHCLQTDSDQLQTTLQLHVTGIHLLVLCCCNSELLRVALVSVANTLKGVGFPTASLADRLPHDCHCSKTARSMDTHVLAFNLNSTCQPKAAAQRTLVCAQRSVIRCGAGGCLQARRSRYCGLCMEQP